MKHRCYQCKCLEDESPAKYMKRTRHDLSARFICKACIKRPITEKKQKEKRDKFFDEKLNSDDIKRFNEFCAPKVEENHKIYLKKLKDYNHSEKGIKTRRRYYDSDVGKGEHSIAKFNKRLDALGRTDKKLDTSHEEKVAIGKFYRKCPDGCQIDHIIPLALGGRHELSNLQYLSYSEHMKKSAIERTEFWKNEIMKTNPFTPIPEPVEEISVGTKKRNKGSKFKKVRRLVEK